jgi:Cysteine-rich CPCC
MTIDPEELEKRKQWFESYVDKLEHHSVIEPAQEDIMYRCPCCGYKTLGERGGYEICDICFWEDDGQDEHDANVVRGGPNGSLILTKARENFQDFGACEERHIKHVRKPLPEEI